jgi:DNA polymerase III subunit epsilon
MLGGGSPGIPKLHRLDCPVAAATIHGMLPVREIVLDTETTGLDPYQGHRLIEIGCVELINRFPSGQSFHRYLNPERDVPADAFAIHGLDAEFLGDKPRFAEIAADLLAFIGDAPLVAHNAMFDLGFLNAEFERAGQISVARERLVDTLLLARRKYPAGPNRLDDLCSRYGIDNSRRTKHGALLDAEILSEVYIELIDARQAQLILVETGSTVPNAHVSHAPVRTRPRMLATRLTGEESAAHAAFVATLGRNAIWCEYLSAGPPGDRIERSA